MKTPQLIILIFIIFLTSILYSNISKGQSETQLLTKPQLVIVAYDISKSFDSYANLTRSHLELIYNGIGKNGGGRFYGLLIKSDSYKQDLMVSQVQPLILLPRKGNGYQLNNIDKKNGQLTEKFEQGEEAFVSPISHFLIKSKIEKFSDIKYALILIQQVLSNPKFDSYSKKVLIISDLENDLPPNEGIDKMDSFTFKDVKIFIVRPSSRIHITDVFAGTTPLVFTTIEDAINSMFTNL